MSGNRHPEEFKIEAAKQVDELSHSVSTRLDSSNKEQSDAQVEIRRLQKEFPRSDKVRSVLIFPSRQ